MINEKIFDFERNKFIQLAEEQQGKIQNIHYFKQMPNHLLVVFSAQKNEEETVTKVGILNVDSPEQGLSHICSYEFPDTDYFVNFLKRD